MLPLIINGYGAFTLTGLGARGIAADSHLLQFAIDVGQRDIGHMFMLIDSHQLIKHGLTRLIDLAQEAKVSRLG
ncbi:hypothetical protein D3C72_1680050 [compost metagenome]